MDWLNSPMESTTHYRLPHPAAKVWALLADFGNLSWIGRGLERIECCGHGIGMTRTMHWSFNDKPSIHRLQQLDSAAMTLSYDIEDTYLPVSNHRIRCQVVSIAKNECELHVTISLTAANLESERDIIAVVEDWLPNTVKAMNAFLSGEPAP